MDNNVRTIYGAKLQTASLLGLDLVINPNSTLNQKFDIYKDELPQAGERPSVRYITIGNGGHKASIGADGIPIINPVAHSPRHAALYNHVPFVVREPSNDLSASERSKYRLRTTAVFNGITYVCYYAKVLDLSTTLPNIELRNNSDGVITANDFTPSLIDLNPSKPNIPLNGNITTTGNYLAATAKVTFKLSTIEIEEILSAANIIYGSNSYAFISEIGLCSGIDRILTGTFNGVPNPYTEVVSTQIANFINTAIALYVINSEVEHVIDIGSVEPLLFN